VTGASSGLGKETVRRLAADGAAVAVNYIGNADAAEEIVEKIRSDGGTAIAVQADVSKESDVVGMFEEIREGLGGCVNVLVNNAGIEKPFKLVDMPLDEWNKVLSVNLTGAFLCAREAARQMIAADEGGVIVNISSVHELIPWPEFSHYCASKGGMRMWSKTIARELAPHQIRVVNIGPGAMLTPINQDLIDHPEKRKEIEEEVPLGRLGEPSEVASAVAWLVSEQASYITGTTLFVDGGMTLYPKFV